MKIALLSSFLGFAVVSLPSIARWFGMAEITPEVPEGAEHPRELGLVRWVRGFESAKSQAAAARMPILILFQEVPGCATCVGYGEQVLSHPLIVEAIESQFVPLAVYNNISGDDRRTLEQFKEPSWNNPVVRIISADGTALAPRLNGDYTQEGLVKAMVTALKAGGKPVPRYLSLLAEELAAESRGTERATFAMDCFWTGEAELGGQDGVVSSKPGFLNGQEVVEVEYDPSIISYESLVRHASTQRCATNVYTRTAEQQKAATQIVGDRAKRESQNIRPDREPKYYLSKHLLRSVPMSTTQASRVNAALARGSNPLEFLSPRQIALFEVIQAHPRAGWQNAIGADFSEAWRSASARGSNP